MSSKLHFQFVPHNDLEFEFFNFAGKEAMSELFRFEVNVAHASSQAVELDSSIGQKVCVTIGQGTLEERRVYGIISEAAVSGQGSVDDEMHDFYRFVVVPRLWKLTLSKRSRVFREKSVPEIIETVLSGCDLKPDVDFRIDRSDDALYEAREYCVQYQESDFAFLSRLMEYEGLLYYFEMDEAEEHEVLVITDKNPDIETLEVELGDVPYNSSVSMEGAASIFEWTARRSMVPDKVTLMDNDTDDFLNGERADAPIEVFSGDGGVFSGSGASGSWAVEESDELLRSRRTEVHSKHHEQESHNTGERQQRLAQIANRRAEAIQSNKAKVFRGRSNRVDFEAKRTFALESHHHFAGKYRLVQLIHVGVQRKLVAGALGAVPTLDVYPDGMRALWEDVQRERDPDDEQSTSSSVYVNAFQCIPRRVAFRPLLSTPIPQVPGILTARVEKQGAYTIDEEGRYQLRMPFDQEGALSGPVRMAQPYTGTDYGMHFPNPEGAEAVVAFIDGNVDRPVMLSTVPTPTFHSPVPIDENEEYATEKEKSVIRSSKGHELVFDDSDGKWRPGITLRVGKKEDRLPSYNSDVDYFFSSTLKMGGRSVEQDSVILGLEKAGFAVDIFKSTLAVDAPRALGSALAAFETDAENFTDKLNGITKIGVKVDTQDTVDISGDSGVTISASNVLGRLQDLVGLPEEAKKVISKAYDVVLDGVIQGVGMSIVDGINKAKEKKEKGSSHPRLQAILEYDENRKRRKLKSLAWGSLATAIGCEGIKLKSTGMINLASMLSVNIASAIQGVKILAYGDIEQTAGAAFDIQANEKISIKTEGRSVGGSKREPWKTMKAVADSVDNQGLIEKARKKWADWESGMKQLPIEIENETGPITIEAKDNNIEQYARNEIKLMADKEKIKGSKNYNISYLDLSSENSIKMGVGLRKGERGSDNAQKEIKSSVSMSEDKGIRIESTESISIFAGKSSIQLEKDGTIRIQGEEIFINGKKSALIKSENGVKLSGKDIDLEATSPAGVPLPKKPDIKSEPVPPRSPDMIEPVESGEVSDPVVNTLLNEIIAEANADIQKDFQAKFQQYEQEVAEWEAYEKQRAKYDAATGKAQASINLSGMDITLDGGKIASKAKMDYTVKCMNYSADADLKHEVKGTMIDTNAKGILSAKGSLTKIG